MKKSKLTFKLDTIEMKNQRYFSIDDWFDPQKTKDGFIFHTQTANMKNIDYNFLVLIHALTEQFLCFRHNISDKEVTGFDMKHTHCSDPGSHKEAPYHTEHQVATDVEAMVSVALNVDWGKYSEAMDKTMKKWKKK